MKVYLHDSMWLKGNMVYYETQTCIYGVSLGICSISRLFYDIYSLTEAKPYILITIYIH